MGNKHSERTIQCTNQYQTTNNFKYILLHISKTYKPLERTRANAMEKGSLNCNFSNDYTCFETTRQCNKTAPTNGNPCLRTATLIQFQTKYKLY